MRSKVLVASALTAFVAATLAACGSGGSPSSPATAPNNIGGGTSPITPQGRSGLSFSARLLDGGTYQNSPEYFGQNVSAVETETTNNAGSDALGPAVPASGASPQPYPIPANPVGTHLLTFSGNGLTQQIFSLNTQALTPPVSTDLTLPASAGQTTPSVYPAIVFYAAATLANGTAPSYDVEISGGSTTSQFDVRVACANAALQSPNSVSGAVGPTTFSRYLCALPAYGSPSGSYVTTVSSSGNSVITGVSYQGAGIANPVLQSATGVFTPSSTTLPGTGNGNGNGGTPPPTYSNQPLLSIVLDEGTSGSTPGGVPLPVTAIGNTLEIDYLYIEGILV